MSVQKYDVMTSEPTSSADKVHALWLKALEKAISVP